MSDTPNESGVPGTALPPAQEDAEAKEQPALRRGDIVEVTRDDGRTEIRQALSDPWQLGHGGWVIKLEGVPGGYALERCRKIEAKAI